MVGHGDDMLRPVRADLRLERLGHDQVLAHRLGGSARFADDAEAGLVQLNHVHQRGHALRVDVVLDVEFRAGALAVRQLIVMQMVQRLMHRDRAERTAADAQHDKVFERLADVFGDLLDFRDDLFLIVRQVHPAEPARAAIRFNRVLRLHGRILHRRKLRLRHAVFAAEHIRHHMIDVKTNVLFHFLSSLR